MKSHTQYIKELFYEQLQQIITRIVNIEQKIEDEQPRRMEEANERIGVPAPMLHHASSVTQQLGLDKDLDIGVLFSEPIFDEKKQR